MKMKPRDITDVRTAFVLNNEGKCGLCQKPIDDPCLDHNHKAPGNVRDAICRRCNSALSRIENTTRYGILDPILFAEQAAAYLRKHQENPSDLIHPTFFTPAEKAQRLKARRARARKAK